MKIAHIVHTSIDHSQGGTATYLRNIVPEQISQGHEVSVVTNKKYKQFGEFSLPVADFNLLGKKKFESLLHSLNANLHLLFSGFDILHYHYVPSACFSFMPAIAGKKRVLTIHGRTEIGRRLKPSTKAVLELVSKFVVPNMDAITTVTPFLNQFVKKTYGRENTYLHHGFKELENIEPNIILKKYGLTKGSYYLALGRLVPIKGFSTIINAYKMLESTSKKLVIAGPPEKDYFLYLKSLISKDLDDKVIFAGCVGGDELGELYSNAFLYIAGNETMGISLTILEAIAHNIPIITSRIPGEYASVKDHTHRFENKDPQNLANLMLTLENDSEERLRLVDTAYRFAVENHNWKHISDTFLSIYGEILSN